MCHHKEEWNFFILLGENSLGDTPIGSRHPIYNWDISLILWAFYKEWNITDGIEEEGKPRACGR